MDEQDTMVAIRNLEEAFSSFNSVPFLFMGSGISRRYLNTPTWEQLLRTFAAMIRPGLPYAYYHQKALNDYGSDALQNVASCIEKDFNESWFLGKMAKSRDPLVSEDVLKRNVDPFHAEVAAYFRQFSDTARNLQPEIDLLRQISEKNVAGIITTNYDSFLEDITQFPVFVGQSEMITSPVTGVGEIYKIHGSAADASSLVLDAKDYDEFRRKTPYLTSKLITIFMENPIVFIGYSISDENIQSILQSIISCYSDKDLPRLAERIFFVQYDPNEGGCSVSSSQFVFAGAERTLPIRQIKLSDFSLLYSAMESIDRKLPTKVLQFLKKQVAEFIFSSKPNKTIMIGDIQDNSINPNALICYIGKRNDMNQRGYIGVSLDDWYRLIIGDATRFDSDELLQWTYFRLKELGYQKIPAYKFVASAKKAIPDYIWCPQSFDDVVTKTAVKNRKNGNIEHRSVAGIINDNPGNISKQCYYLQYLLPEEINLDDMKEWLASAISPDCDIFQMKSAIKCSFRNIVRMYDYLKYKK